MAQVSFRGICNGTVERVSQKTGKTYKITQFVEISDAGLTTLDVFGDLGLPRDVSIREYRLEARVTGLSGVSIITGAKLPEKGA